MNYIRSIIALCVIPICYSLTVAAAATDLFEGLSDQNYNAPIISIVRQQNVQDSAIQFQVLSETAREGSLVSLFKMFGTEEQIMRAEDDCRWNLNYRDYEAMPVQLIHLASALRLQPAAELRRQLFYIPEKRNAAESMFYRLIKDKEVSCEEIYAWFPQEDAAQNKQYMTDFLNHFQPKDKLQFRADEVQKLRAVCEHIDIDWDSVRCLPRMLIHGTIHAAEEEAIKQFFNHYGVDFQEQRDGKIEEHRREVFIDLIRAADKPNKEQRFREVMEFLGEYPYVCFVDRLLYYLDPMCEAVACFKLDIKPFCAYIFSLPLCSPEYKGPGYNGYASFHQVRHFLDVCNRLSMKNFLQACALLSQDPRFADFPIRSKTIIEQYIYRYAATEESVRGDYCGLSSAVPEEHMTHEMLHRRINNTKLTALLFSNEITRG